MPKRKPADIWDIENEELAEQKAEERAYGVEDTEELEYAERMQRERQILKLVSERAREIPDIVANAYPGLDPRLIAAAGGSVFAHLLDLERRGMVVQEGELWTGTGSDSRS